MENPQAVHLSECYKEVANIGYSVWQNVCNGTSSVVPWGAATWITVSVAFILLAIPAVLVGSILYSIYKETR